MIMFKRYNIYKIIIVYTYLQYFGKFLPIN